MRNRGPPSHRPVRRPPRARRRCDPERVDANPVASAAIGGCAPCHPHARTRAASTGDTHPQRRSVPAAGGRVGPAPTPAGRHVDWGGWRHQQQHGPVRPDRVPTRVAVVVLAGRPPSRRLSAISGAAAAGRFRGCGGGHRSLEVPCAHHRDGSGHGGGGLRRLGCRFPAGRARHIRSPTSTAPATGREVASAALTTPRGRPRHSQGSGGLENKDGFST